VVEAVDFDGQAGAGRARELDENRVGGFEADPPLDGPDLLAEVARGGDDLLVEIDLCAGD
jgi:hypothetical protein